jgi:steroid delta-isomerase-like uncharacterized protein
MSEQDFVGLWAQAVNPFDPAALSALFADDAVYEDVPIGKVFEGRSEIERNNRESVQTVPDLRLEDVSGFVVGATGAIEWRMAGSMRAEGSDSPTAFAVRGASILQLRDGLVSRCSDYWDLGTMMRQLSGGSTSA